MLFSNSKRNYLFAIIHLLIDTTILLKLENSSYIPQYPVSQRLIFIYIYKRKRPFSGLHVVFFFFFINKHLSSCLPVHLFSVIYSYFQKYLNTLYLKSTGLVKFLLSILKTLACLLFYNKDFMSQTFKF